MTAWVGAANIGQFVQAVGETVRQRVWDGLIDAREGEERSHPCCEVSRGFPKNYRLACIIAATSGASERRRAVCPGRPHRDQRARARPPHPRSSTCAAQHAVATTAVDRDAPAKRPTASTASDNFKRTPPRRAVSSQVVVSQLSGSNAAPRGTGSRYSSRAAAGNDHAGGLHSHISPNWTADALQEYPAADTRRRARMEPTNLG
ncbi:MAG: hypothetical protein JWR32_248 [Mycobacterium sp.]|jgi:hypothetical protein|nr:hypothetical protein [Mycobacterium sp.]